MKVEFQLPERILSGCRITFSWNVPCPTRIESPAADESIAA
jgi:hypothetical protein